MYLVPMPIDCTITDLVRLWAKVDRVGRGPNDCWPWSGCIKVTTDQYGAFQEARGYFMLAGYSYLASRVAYYFEHRQDPAQLLVLHACDNSLCTNPAHLELGTAAENRRDMFARGRYSLRGSRNTNAALHEEMIPGIRKRLATGEKVASIARSLGVSYWTIKDIETGRRWSHVL